MWYKVNNEEQVSTPALLIYPDRIKENIRRMINIAGDAKRLRPHVKTHKMAEVVQLQVQQGITKFKCATLAELEMSAKSGGTDLLLAYPLLGPDIQIFLNLKAQFENVQFAVTVDAFDACAELTRAAIQNNTTVDVFIDIDNGMHRTGASPEEALDLAEKLRQSEFLNLKGLHIYDGHIHIAEPEIREAELEHAFSIVIDFVDDMKQRGIEVGELACGGTFSFPFHAKDPGRTLCPGTPLLWDAGYEKNIPDLDFLHAAVLAGRVISTPDTNICLDLGYKAMAAEMPQPRLEFLDLHLDSIENQSEEHLVIKARNAEQLQLGDMIYGIPHHICPTVALHDQVYVVSNNKTTKKWKVSARDRIY